MIDKAGNRSHEPEGPCNSNDSPPTRPRPPVHGQRQRRGARDECMGSQGDTEDVGQGARRGPTAGEGDGGRSARMNQAREPRGHRTASSAQSRLDARNSRLAISLADHAERVARRDEEGSRPAQTAAAERLAALRRRIAERQAVGAGGGSAAGGRVAGGGSGRAGNASADDTGGRGVGGTATWSGGEPEAGNASTLEEDRGRNELRKIHLEAEEDCTTRIRDDPAWWPSGKANQTGQTSEQEAVGEPSCLQGRGLSEQSACGGGASMPSDVAHAASRVAWHTALHGTMQPR